MTSGSTFPKRLTKLDELTRPDHSYLTAEDDCFFLGEYTARGGYSFSDTNQLVLNFKKDMSKQGQPEWKWKGVAIRQAASAFATAIDSRWLDRATLVPIPPSKARNDPLYDDRLVRMLRAIRPTGPLDVRELVVQAQSTAAAHQVGGRPGPVDLLQLYHCDLTLLDPVPQIIGIFDDVLTTGAHFKAVQMLLRRQFPAARIIGFFIARRVPDTADPDEFDVLE